MPKHKNHEVLKYVRRMTDEQLTAALTNVGVNLECGGCAAALFTGYGEPHTCGVHVMQSALGPVVLAAHSPR